MKILQLLGNTAFGGATRIVLDISEALREADHDVEIMANDYETKQCFEDAGFVVHEIGTMCRAIHPLKDLKSIFVLKKWIRTNHIDCIHSHTTKGGVYSRFLKHIAKEVLVVHTVHGYYLKGDNSWRDKMTLGIEDYLLPWADCTTFVNSMDYEYAKKKKPDENLVLIYNGIDTEEFIPIEHIEMDLKKIGISARIVKEKGYDEFFKLVEHYKECNDIVFEIIGSGPDESYYRAYAEDHGLLKRMIFKSFVPNVVEVISDWDINVLPSYREGLSISLLEAMSCGVPSVATAIRGNVEIIDDGVDGFLFEVKDDRSLIEAVDKLLGDSALRKEISLKARNKVQSRFDVQIMKARYVQVVDQLNEENE